MLVTGKKVLSEAMRKRYAVGAFNVYNLETLQAVVRAAERLRSSVIVQTSEAAIEYAGYPLLGEMVEVMAKHSKVPIVLHLDHGRNISVIKNCLKLGYTSIMFDGSFFNFKKNLNLTRKVVSLVHKKGASVEAELGRLGGREDDVLGGSGYTNPDEAREFVEKTGIDSLAIAIGTSHGVFKKSAGKLRFDLLKEIREKVKIPLVLHGASMVDKNVVAKAKRFGLKVGNFKGVSEGDIRKAVKFGISKVNVDTDLRLVFTAAMREFLKKHPNKINPRDSLTYATSEMQKNVEKHIRIFNLR